MLYSCAAKVFASRSIIWWYNEWMLTPCIPGIGGSSWQGCKIFATMNSRVGRDLEGRVVQPLAMQESQLIPKFKTVSLWNSGPLNKVIMSALDACKFMKEGCFHVSFYLHITKKSISVMITV